MCSDGEKKNPCLGTFLMLRQGVGRVAAAECMCVCCRCEDWEEKRAHCNYRVDVPIAAAKITRLALRQSVEEPWAARTLSLGTTIWTHCAFRLLVLA